MNGKFGFVDTHANFVIPCKFDTASDFSDGLSQVSLGKDKFFIDRTGKTIIDKFNDDVIKMYDFHEGFSPVIFKDHSCGYVDKNYQPLKLPVKLAFA